MRFVALIETADGTGDRPVSMAAGVFAVDGRGAVVGNCECIHLDSPVFDVALCAVVEMSIRTVRTVRKALF